MSKVFPCLEIVKSSLVDTSPSQWCVRSSLSDHKSERGGNKWGTRRITIHTLIPYLFCNTLLFQWGAWARVRGITYYMPCSEWALCRSHPNPLNTDTGRYHPLARYEEVEWPDEGHSCYQWEIWAQASLAAHEEVLLLLVLSLLLLEFPSETPHLANGSVNRQQRHKGMSQ